MSIQWCGTNDRASRISDIYRAQIHEKLICTLLATEGPDESVEVVITCKQHFEGRENLKV